MQEPQMVHTTTPNETCEAYRKLGYKVAAVETPDGWYVCYARNERELQYSINACNDGDI
jgi:hypothetical protein